MASDESNNPSALSPAGAAPILTPRTPQKDAGLQEFTVYRHSNLFYWWPIWFFGYIMAGIAYFGDWHMAIVPAQTKTAEAVSGTAKVEDRTIELAGRSILVLDEGKKHRQRKDADGQLKDIQPKIFVSPYKGNGTLYMIILLLVIVITNIHFRGLWSVVVMVVLIMLSIVFAVAGWWELIFTRMSLLAIHINMGGYLFLSTVLLVLWLVNFFYFDRQTYMVFATGQVRMRLEIGGEETIYDTTGMVVQKQRSDLFRHWILGFGSGDLVIRPVGVAKDIELPNVLRAGKVVRHIEQLVKEKVVLATE